MTDIDTVDRYKNAADGKQALEKMNGFDLAGRQVMWENKTCFLHVLTTVLQLKVGLVTERAAAASYGNLDDEGKLYLSCILLPILILCLDSAGLSLNSLARAELMHKLAARQSDMMEEEYRQSEEASTTPTAP